jgi:hypothetical protein
VVNLQGYFNVNLTFEYPEYPYLKPRDAPVIKMFMADLNLLQPRDAIFLNPIESRVQSALQRLAQCLTPLEKSGGAQDSIL